LCCVISLLIVVLAIRIGKINSWSGQIAKVVKLLSTQDGTKTCQYFQLLTVGQYALLQKTIEVLLHRKRREEKRREEKIERRVKLPQRTTTSKRSIVSSLARPNFVMFGAFTLNLDSCMQSCTPNSNSSG